MNQNYTQDYFNTLLKTHVSNQAVVQLTQQQNALSWDSFLEVPPLSQPNIWHPAQKICENAHKILAQMIKRCCFLLFIHFFHETGLGWAVNVVQEAFPCQCILLLCQLDNCLVTDMC